MRLLLGRLDPSRCEEILTNYGPIKTRFFCFFFRYPVAVVVFCCIWLSPIWKNANQLQKHSEFASAHSRPSVTLRFGNPWLSPPQHEDAFLRWSRRTCSGEVLTSLVTTSWAVLSSHQDSTQNDGARRVVVVNFALEPWNNRWIFQEETGLQECHKWSGEIYHLWYIQWLF